MKKTILAPGALSLAVLALTSVTQGVTFQLVTQLDTAALNAGVPGSVAAYGNDVYIGNLFGGGQLHQITDPLGTPMNAATFGGLTTPGPTTNGYVSLNTDGTSLVAATNNGGGDPDIVQVYTVGTNALNWAADSSPGSANITGDRIDGAAVDPIQGNVLVTAFGSGNQHLFTAGAGASVPGATSALFDAGVGTGWRDVDFDNVTGDIVLRAVNGVARGRRDLTTNPGAPGDYDKLDGVSAGIQTIVNAPDGFNSAINVEFIPGNLAGQELVIFNVRNNPDTFADQVLVYDANSVDNQVAASFLDSGGSPFSTSSAASGIYDFSFDPVNELLYVSDFSTSQVHVFSIVPEPTGLVIGLLGLLCVTAVRRS